MSKQPKRPVFKHLQKLSGDSETGMYCVKGSMWQHAVMALAQFPDGKIRSVRLKQQADSYFSWPGRASYGRHTVKCFVTCDEGRVMGHYETSALQEVMGR